MAGACRRAGRTGRDESRFARAVARRGRPAERANWRAPRRASPSWRRAPTSTRWSRCSTGAASSASSTARSPMCGATAARPRCCSSISTASRRSTTPMAMRSAMPCSRRWPRALAGHVRASDVVGRLGGDEFGVLMWNIGEAQARRQGARTGGANRGHRTRARRRRCWRSAPAPALVMLSPEASPAAAIDAADRAMYARKRERRGRRMLTSIPQRGRLRDNIRRELVFDGADAVAQHELALFSRCTWIKSAPGEAASATIAASRSRCSCCRRANCSRNSRSSSSVIATAGSPGAGRSRPKGGMNYRVFHRRVQAAGKRSLSRGSVTAMPGGVRGRLFRRPCASFGLDYISLRATD